jgi:murein endopeptidase
VLDRSRVLLRLSRSVRSAAAVLSGLAAFGCASAPPLPASASLSATPPEARDSAAPELDAGGRAEAPVPPVAPTGEVEDPTEIDDGAEESTPVVVGRPYQHPLDGWSRSKLEAALARDPASLGSMSIGSTNGGALFNGVQMPTNVGWELVDPDRAWGTLETVTYLSHCLQKVRDEWRDAPTMFIGHISGRRGGHLSPHVSHQAGRDADVSYYYLPPGARWYVTATAQNLDRGRTWAFVRALITDTDVELILIDRALQRLIRDYAIERGEDRGWVDQLFDGGPSLPPLIRHAKGHASHLHVRFYNPLAQETARRTYDLLLKHGIVAPPVYEVMHKVKPGETLSHLILKYRVSAKAIQKANGLKTTLLKIGHSYKIPRQGTARVAARPTLIPARRVPPEATKPEQQVGALGIPGPKE